MNKTEMNKTTIKIKGVILFVLLVFSVAAFAQKKIRYRTSLSSAFGTDNELPFWFVSNKNGIIPNHGYVMSGLSMKRGFDNRSKAVNFMWEASGYGYTGTESKLLVDQLYVGLEWKFFRLYIGQKDYTHNILSSTNGDLLHSNNARAYPKYELSIPYWKNVPFTNGIISFTGLLSDGITTDNRYIDNARIHHKNLYVRAKVNCEFSASFGIEHYALWGGTHPERGNISGSLNKYFKIFKVEGDDSATFDNDNYCLGDHIGSYRFDLFYRSNIKLNAYYQTVFEDGSGARRNNFPDGLYGISFRNRSKIIQSVVVEFYHTTDQCGEIFSIGDEILGGRDNYFNHGEYRSGWTHHGRTIGSPLFTTGFADGHTVIANNRFKAFHVGVLGYLGIPYKAYFTFSKNYGTYANPYSSGLNQFSGYLEVNVPVRRIPFKIDLACAADKGELLKDKVGFYIKLSRAGIIKW